VQQLSCEEDDERRLFGVDSGGRTWSLRLRSVTAAEWVGAEEREEGD